MAGSLRASTGCSRAALPSSQERMLSTGPIAHSVSCTPSIRTSLRTRRWRAHGEELRRRRAHVMGDEEHLLEPQLVEQLEEPCRLALHADVRRRRASRRSPTRSGAMARSPASTRREATPAHSFRVLGKPCTSSTGAPLPASSRAMRVMSRRADRRCAWRSPPPVPRAPRPVPSPPRAAPPPPAPRPPPRREGARARIPGGPGAARG